MTVKDQVVLEAVKRWSIPLIFIALTSVAIVLRLLPYLIHDYYFVVGFDTGMYMRLTSFYVESDSWSILPAYPELPLAYSSYISQVDAGFLVFSASIVKFSGMDIIWFFKYYLPAFVTTFSALVCFIAGNHIAKSPVGGLVAVALFSFSYVQMDSLNESYHRLVIATLLIVLASVLLDKFVETSKRNYLASSMLLFAGTIAYHISAVIMVFIITVFATSYLAYKKDAEKLRYLSFGTIIMLLVSSIVWYPKLPDYLNVLWATIEKSIWRSSTLFSGEGFWLAGGGVPELFRDYSHIILGYADVFTALIILVIVSYAILWFTKRMSMVLPFVSIFLWIYISMWFFYGNRMLTLLDLLICTIIPVVFVFILSIKTKMPYVKVAALALASLSLISPFTIAVQYQAEKAPYIVNNMEGVEWIVDNIDAESSIIFAPDYISIDLLQIGYDMAIWDFTLTDQTVHPLRTAEEFMLMSPTNETYLLEFFSENPRYRDLNIYVIWGEADADRPLISSKQLIPISDYRTSDNFVQRYHGRAEILEVYQYVGPIYEPAPFERYFE